MKTQLLKRLSACLPASMALLTWMIFSVSIANAQIIYTDVEPDLKFTQSTAGSNAYNLDLNKDSITDVILTANQTTTSGGGPRPRPTITRRVLAATASGSNLFMVKVSPLVPNGLALNARVDSTSEVWASATAGLLRQSNSSTGKWVDTTDRFLAIRIYVAGNWHYGWVRLSVVVTTSNISFTVRDYAYNSIPNQSILAGETSCIAPTLTLNASGPLSFCKGESVQLNAVTNFAYLHHWFKNGNKILGVDSTLYNATATGAYYVIAGNSCGNAISSVDSVFVFAEDKSVTVSGKSFTANAVNASYQWIDCSTKQAVSGATAKTFSPSIEGSYAVVITENGCSDTSLCYTFCNVIDTSVTVSGATLTANAAGATYQWINCFWREPVIGATAKTFSPKFSGTYAVIVKVNNNCNDTSSCYNITATGIESEIFAPAITLYPNPAKSHVTLDLGDNNKRVEVELMDMNGKVVYTNIASSQQIEIDTKEFGKGVYFLRVQAENYLVTKKLLIE